MIYIPEKKLVLIRRNLSYKIEIFCILFTPYLSRLTNTYYKMRYVAAYMLAMLGGNKAPTEEDIKKILGSVDVEYNPEQSKKVVSELSGKNIDELIQKGSEKLATIPSGGGGAAAASGAAPAAAEEKKEEKKEEEEEEEDDDMGFNLFD